MVPHIPWYITLIVVATNLVIATVVWRILVSATLRSGLTPAVARMIRIGTALFLFGWLGAVFLLAPGPEALLGRGAFYLNPLLPFFAALSAVIVLLAVVLSPAVRTTLSAVSLPAVHGVQLYRLIGAVFLVLLTRAQLPAHFAIPAGWGDVFVGATALLVGLALARQVPGARVYATAWNLFGLLDLIVALGMGTGYFASLLGSDVPPVAAMGMFPLILVPTYAVPISVMLHLLALTRLRRSATSV